MTFAQPFTDYEILDRVGSGAMGTVFKARQKNLNRIVALKVLKPSLARDERYVDRLRREAHIVASFNHENIVQGFDLGEEGGYHFFVMEFVEGRSLRELLIEWGSFSEEKVLDVAINVASALDHAYRKGVIHRDIKPGNILIDDGGRVKLTDMGLAKGPTDLTITRDGATVGTPQYISPEQARDPQNVDVRSDLYSLGATLFHMVTGQPPFRADTMAKIILKLLQEPAPAPRNLDPEISEGLDLVIRKLLVKDPDLRYQTPGELLDDLRKVQRDETPDVDARALERDQKKASAGIGGRHALMWGGGFAAVAALALAAVFVFGGDRNNVPEPDGGKDKPAEYRAEVGKALVDAKTWPDRLRVLTTREATAAPWQKEILGQARTNVERELGVELSALLEKQKAGARTWVDQQQDWRNLQTRYIDEELPRAIHAELKLRLAELPRSLLDRYDQQARALRTAVREQEKVLTQGYLARHQMYLRGVPAKYRLHLELDNFVLAQRTLREEIAAFFSGEGLPPFAQVPTSVRTKVTAAEADVRAKADLEIGRRRKVALKNFDECLGGGEKAVRAFLEQPTDPKRAEARALGLREELEAHWPEEHFEAEHNPWPAARQVLAMLADAIEKAWVVYRTEQLNDYLTHLYGSMVRRGWAGKAAEFLTGVRTLEGSKHASKHVDLLRAAEAVRNEMLLAMLAGARKRSIKMRLRGSSDAQIVVLDLNGGRPKMTAQGKTVDLPQVDLGELEARAKKGGFDISALGADKKAGLAVWHWLGGDKQRVNALLEKGQLYDFVTTVGTRVIDRLPQQRPGPEVQAFRLWTSVVSLHQQRQWIEMRKAIAQLRLAHAAYAKKNAVDLREFENDARIDLHVAKLRGDAGPGVVLALDKKFEKLTVDYDLSRAPASLPAGFGREGTCLTGGDSSRDLAFALKNSLVLPTLLGAECDQVNATIRVRFPAEGRGRQPRLLLLVCHDVHIALGLLRDGSGTAVQIRPNDLQRPDALRRSCEKEAARLVRKKDPFRFESGVDYDLKLRVEHQRRRLRYVLTVDGHELLSGTMSEPPRITPKLRLLPLHAVEICKIRLVGRL